MNEHPRSVAGESRRFPIHTLPLAIFMVAVAFFAVSLLSGKDPSKLDSAMIGKPAPGFDLPGIGDIPALTPDMLGSGRSSIVNVFASWCLPCRAEHAVLMAFAAEHDIPIYGINYKDSKTDAQEWLDRNGNPYTAIAHDETGKAVIDWGVYGVPETFVIDGHGIIRHRHAGPLSRSDLYDTILPMIAEQQR